MTVCNIMFMHLTCIHVYDIGIIVFLVDPIVPEDLDTLLDT